MGSWELDSVSEIKVRWGSSTSASEDVAFGFSVATCLDEATMKAVKLSNGRIVEIPPISEMEVVEFPEPVGRQQTYAILHSELATLPKFVKGVRYVTYKDSWDQATIDVVKFLRSSGFASDKMITLDGRKVSPRKLLLTLLSPNEPRTIVGCLMVSVLGKSGGKPMEAAFCLGPIHYNDTYRAPCTAYSTAIPASIVAQMISGGGIGQKGVLPPEALTRNQIEHFLRQMEARGLAVKRLPPPSSSESPRVHSAPL